MFGFLKDKLKGALNKFSKKVEEEPDEIIEQEVPKKKPEPKKEKPKKVPQKPKQSKSQKEIKKVEEKEAEILEKEKEILKEEKKIMSKPSKKEIISEEAKDKEDTDEELTEELEKKEAPKSAKPASEPIVESEVDKEVKEAVKEVRTQELAEDLVDKEKELEVAEKKKGFLSRIFSKKEEKPSEEPLEEKTEPEKDSGESIPELEKEEPEKKQTFIQKVTKAITTKKISPEKFEELFWELELALLENNVAVEVIEKIKKDLREPLVNKPIARSQIFETIANSLKSSITEILSIETIDLNKKIAEKKPYVICFVGINGSGKTTTIAKMANKFKNEGKSVILAAADTFRAAAIDQLQHHGDKLGIKVIKQDYGSDPAAVAYDAIDHAKAKGIDIVMIDTAGRMHSNSNLIDEMKKIIRVAQPDLKLFIGESITGNDCIEQAQKFNEAIEIDGVILSKADIDEKGGAALSVSYVTKKPILYIGVGQEYDDIKEFTPKVVLDNLGL